MRLESCRQSVRVLQRILGIFRTMCRLVSSSALSFSACLNSTIDLIYQTTLFTMIFGLGLGLGLESRIRYLGEYCGLLPSTHKISLFLGLARDSNQKPLYYRFAC